MGAPANGEAERTGEGGKRAETNPAQSRGNKPPPEAVVQAAAAGEWRGAPRRGEQGSAPPR